MDPKLTREAYGSILACLHAQIAFGWSVKSALARTSRKTDLPLYSTSVSDASDAPMGGWECLTKQAFLPYWTRV